MAVRERYTQCTSILHTSHSGLRQCKGRRESVLSLEDRWWFEEKKKRAKNTVECACHEARRLSKLFLAAHKDSNYSHGPVLASPYFVQLIPQQLDRNVSIFLEIHRIVMLKIHDTHF